jgi:rhodanese-related sulfurtransferase
MGFEDVANLDGGLTAWKEAGLPVAEHHAGIA